MECQEDRVFIGFLVARERELYFGSAPFKRRLLSLLRNLHAPSGDHERFIGTRIHATVDEPLRSHAVAQVQASPFVATHVTSEKIESHGLIHLVRKQNAVFVINLTQASIRMETTARREHLVQENFCPPNIPSFRSVGDACVCGRAALRSAKKW